MYTGRVCFYLRLDCQDNDEWIEEAGSNINPLEDWMMGSHVILQRNDCQFVQAPERRDSWRAPGSLEDAAGMLATIVIKAFPIGGS